MKLILFVTLSMSAIALPQPKGFARNLVKQTGQGAAQAASGVVVDGVGQLGSAMVQKQIGKAMNGDKQASAPLLNQCSNLSRLLLNIHKLLLSMPKLLLDLIHSQSLLVCKNECLNQEEDNKHILFIVLVISDYSFF
jgi:hypothetical protein